MEQPEALRLVEQLNRSAICSEKAAAELRRLHALNAELVDALQAFIDEVEGTFPFASLPAARAAIAKATV